MIFMLFAVAIAVLFFAGSLILLRLGQHLGLRHRKRSGSEGIGGLATVESAMRLTAHIARSPFCGRRRRSRASGFANRRADLDFARYDRRQAARHGFGRIS